YGVPLADETQKPSIRLVKRSELGLKTGDFLVLCIARLVAQKRPLFFLEIAKVIHQRFAATKFLWVGDGELSRQWDDWVAREKLSNVIWRVSWQADVAPFLFAGALLLHVTEYEGLPLSIAEAVSTGLP